MPSPIEFDCLNLPSDYGCLPKFFESYIRNNVTFSIVGFKFYWKGKKRTANPTRMAKFKEGVVAWNKWRKGNPETIGNRSWISRIHGKENQINDPTPVLTIIKDPMITAPTIIPGWIKEGPLLEFRLFFLISMRAFSNLSPLKLSAIILSKYYQTLCQENRAHCPLV